jgi:periplasmic copper chaperone A
MKKFALAAVLFLGLSTPSFAGDITVDAVWARASAGMARAGAAFMTIKNTGPADRLIAAKSDVSKTAELHTHINDNGTMKMREIEGGLVIPEKETVMLQPGGNHVMFMGLAAPFEEGTTFPLTLIFEKAGEIKVDVTIQGVGAMGKAMGNAMIHDTMKMDHGNMKMK